jgi:Tat protein translocase TatB subunit
MFGLGMGELLVILAIALIVLGPQKLPDAAASLGRAIRSFRKATQELTDQIEIDDEVKQPLRELKAALRNEPGPLPTPSPAPGSVALDARAPTNASASANAAPEPAPTPPAKS